MKTKHLLLVLLTILIPIASWGNVWQDPETKVNYEYTVGNNEASVKAGSFYRAGSPDVNGDVVIFSMITINGNDYNVTSIGQYAFYGCKVLTSITLPNNITSIGSYAFSECSGLTAITIPDNVTSIGFDAFSFCTGLKSITIPNSVTSLDGTFVGCSSLTSITIPNSVTSLDGTFDRCSSLTSITIPNSVTSIGDYAFSECRGLTSITIPNSVTSIGEYVFYNCSGLTSIEIGNNVTSIGAQTFNGCTGLTSITIPNSVTSIEGWAFIGCSSLNTAIIHCKEIGSLWFIDLKNLKNVFIGDEVRIIGDSAFENCSNLASVTIGNNVTSIGAFAFACCSSLTSIMIPNSVTSIGYGAFEGCNGLTHIEIGNSVTSIGDFAFESCSNLTSVTIPNSVTSIGVAAFECCSGLTSITIPNSVTSIGSSAFSCCSSLSEIISEIEKPFSINFVFDNNTYNEAILYVPAGTLDAYHITNGWKDFRNIIETPNFKVTETSLMRGLGQIHVKIGFSSEPYSNSLLLDEYVSFASDTESLTLTSFTQSNNIYDLFFTAPKKAGTYTLTIHNTLYDTKGNYLNQNDNDLIGEETDNYIETFTFGGDELYVVAQAPLTGGILGENSYTDLVFNYQVDSIPTSSVFLESPSGKSIAIHSVEYIDSVKPARHRIHYGELDEDGLYTFTLSKGLVSKNGKVMSYPYQSSIETPAANLVPEIVTPINGNWIAGTKQSIQYTVKNTGTKPAKDECVDVIYLSTTEFWNSEVIELYRDTISIDIGAQDIYTQTISVNVPPVVDGNYYLILKTNVTHNVNELSFADNNLSAEGLKVSVDVLSDENNTFTLKRGESKIFRVQTESDQNVEIIDKHGIANMFLGYYQLPNTCESPSQGSITILGADASVKYYILVSNNGKSQTEFQQCELSMRNFELEIGSIGRATIIKHGTAWVPIEVKGCIDVPSFYLMDSKGVKTECKKVVAKTETSFYAQFDTESLAIGQYGLYVESNGMTGLKQNAITVTNEQAQINIISKLVLPATSRIGSTITAYIDYYNSGNVDLPAPLFILSGTEGSIYELPTGGTFKSEAHIIGVNENGVVSALMPGESNRISVNITIPNEGISSADYKLKTITEGCEGIEEPFYLQWFDVEPSETPLYYTDEEWNAYCNRLRNNVGDTWRTFIQALGKAADMFYTEGNIDYNATFIYDIIKQIDFNSGGNNGVRELARKRVPSTLRDVEPGTIFIWRNGQWNQVVRAVYEYYEEAPDVPVFVGWAKTDKTNLIDLSATKNFIISHGWNDDRNGKTKELAIALDATEDNCNIYGIDWSRASTTSKEGPASLGANIPAARIPDIARKVIDAFCFIYSSNKNNLRLNNLHLIGHSHGAHLCGMIAHYLNFKPHRLTALDASQQLSHLWSSNFMGSGWNSSDVLFLDYYKSSVMAGTNRFKGNNNFILIMCDNGFTFNNSLDKETEKIRHGYSIDWFAKTIREKDIIDKNGNKCPIGYNLNSTYLSKQWGKGYNENQYHGVINGSKDIIENFSIREDYSIDSDDWNYTEPWYGKKLYQGLFNDNIFQNALASSIEYAVKGMTPYQNGKDYIQSGTRESIKVSIENRADNATIPLNVRVDAVQPIAANTLFITNSENSSNYSYSKDKEGFSQIIANTDLYILGYNSDYCDISLDGKDRKSDIEFTISSTLWDKLAGNNKDKDYINCTLWFIAACDKEFLLGDWYNSSKSMYYPFSDVDYSYRTIKLAKGELYAKNNVDTVSVRVKNPKLACSAGDDRVVKLQKGQEKTSVTLYGKVTRDNGKTLSYYWEKAKSVFSTSENGSISLGVGKHRLIFRIKAEGGNARSLRESSSSENEAEDDVVITVEPYTPGNDDDESTFTASSWDPNEKVGIKGAGGKACVKPGEMMEYSIYFENDAEKALLAAQKVTVIDTLDVAFDLSTFEFTGSEVSNTVVDIPTGMVETTVYTDMRPNNDLILKTDMKLDIDSRVITVVYSSLDTLTNEPTQDVFAGFLPPNDSTHIGEGHFSYRVKLKDDIAEGYIINNQAHIFFDFNDEIATNITSHAVDNSAPASWMIGLPRTTDQDSILVEWTGSDNGSGIKHYDIYCAKNGGSFGLWKEKTSESSAYVRGIAGDKYEFFSIATDSLGYVENMKTEAEATITFIADDQIELVTSESGNGVEIYPRVVTEQFTVSIRNANNYNVISTEVFDLTGRSYMTEKNAIKSTSYIQNYNCQYLVPGVYLVNVNADNKRLATVKIIKK